MENKVKSEVATVRKKQRQQKVEQGQSGQTPFPIYVHPQGGEEAADGVGVMGTQCVKGSSSKKSRVLKKQQPLPKGFFPTVANPNSIDQDTNYSSPFGAFFAQFAYKPDRQQDGKGPPLPNIAVRPASLPPRCHPSSGSSLLTASAKATSKATRTTTLNTKQMCPVSASTSVSQEVRINGKEMPEKMAREMAMRESLQPLATLESKSAPLVPVAPEILTLATMTAATVTVRRVKEREWKNQEALPASLLMEEPVRKEGKQHKKRKHGEAAVVIPSSPTAAVAQFLQMESNVTAAVETVRKNHMQRVVEQEQSGQPSFPIDIHPQAGKEAAAAGGVMGSQCVKRSSSKKSRVLKKQQPLPQGFSSPMANPNSTDQDLNYSSPFGAFFAQFAYKPDRRQHGNGPPLPNTFDRPAKLPPRGHPLSGSSLFTAKETSKAARITNSNSMQPCSSSASTSGSQEGVKVKGKEKPEKMATEMAMRESLQPFATPESMSAPLVPVAPEILTLATLTAATVTVRRVKEREWKNQEALPASQLMEEPVRKEGKNHKKRKHGEAAVVIPSSPTAAVAQFLQMESNVTAAGETVRKKHMQWVVEQEKSGQPSFPIDVHPQAGEETAAAGGVMGSQCVKTSSSKKSRVLKKQQPLPQGFSPPMANPNSTDQDLNYSSPFGAFFAQFAYKPDRRQHGNGPPLPNTIDRPARLPPRGHPSSGSSLFTAIETSKAARITNSNSMQPCSSSASTSGSQEGVKVKGKEKPEKMATEMAMRESLQPFAAPESKSAPLVPVAPEILTLATMTAATVTMRRVKEREWKNQEALPASLLMEEPVRKEGKQHKKRKHGEAAVVIPSSPTAAVAQFLQMESNVTAAVETVRKNHMQRVVEQEQSGQPSFPIDIHPQAGEEAAAAGGVMGSQCVKRSSSKKSCVLKKQQPPPQGFSAPMANPNSTDQDLNYSSPFGAFFAQFAYKPDRRQHGNGPLPNTIDRPARLPPRGHPSSGSSLFTAKETSKAARTTNSNTMQPCSSSASTSCSQEGVRVKGKEKPEKMATEQKLRKPAPSLSSADKQLDKYRRLSLDQLVLPPRSPHMLLQEEYASDPWKIIVICMLLNLTQGKQVRKKVTGFFERYPDPETAYTADPEKMAEYLAPLGLQHVKANRIQKFSKAYVGEEWTHITQLCGVGKYAADAYAIFCAGRAEKVVPEDHKLVDYWKYVCFELPSIQKSNCVPVARIPGWT